MRRVVTKQELDTLVKANDTVRGTHDYMKYFMMMNVNTNKIIKYLFCFFLKFWGTQRTPCGSVGCRCSPSGGMISGAENRHAAAPVRRCQ